MSRVRAIRPSPGLLSSYYTTYQSLCTCTLSKRAGYPPGRLDAAAHAAGQPMSHMHAFLPWWPLPSYPPPRHFPAPAHSPNARGINQRFERQDRVLNDYHHLLPAFFRVIPLGYKRGLDEQGLERRSISYAEAPST